MLLKKMVLVILSLLLIVISFYLKGSLVLHSEQHFTSINMINELNKYQNEIFFSQAIKKDLEIISNKLDSNLNIDYHKLINEIKIIELKLKSDAILSLKQRIKVIDKQRIKINNKYLKKSQNSYQKFINSYTRDRKKILNIDLKKVSLIKLLEYDQDLTLHDLTNNEYLKIVNRNIIKAKSSEKRVIIVNKNQKPSNYSPKNNKKKITKQKKETNYCQGLLYSTKNAALNKQSSLLAKNKASTIYEINNKWCLISY